MARYEKHETDEGKYQSTFDGYGHGEGNGKSRQSINRHFKKNESFLESVVESVTESVDDTSTESDTVHKWRTVNDESPGDSKLSSLPSPARSMLKTFSTPDKKRSKAEKEVFQKKQSKMIRYFFSGVIDPLTSAYCRGVMGERGQGWNLERTAEDWELFESVTESWIEYHEFNIPMNPDLLMLGCLGSYYAPPIYHAHKNPRPDRVGVFGKIKGRFIRWRAKRKMKKLGVEELE